MATSSTTPASTTRASWRAADAMLRRLAESGARVRLEAGDAAEAMAEASLAGRRRTSTCRVAGGPDPGCSVPCSSPGARCPSWPGRARGFLAGSGSRPGHRARAASGDAAPRRRSPRPYAAAARSWSPAPPRSLVADHAAGRTRRAAQHDRRPAGRRRGDARRPRPAWGSAAQRPERGGRCAGRRGHRVLAPPRPGGRPRQDCCHRARDADPVVSGRVGAGRRAARPVAEGLRRSAGGGAGRRRRPTCSRCSRRPAARPVRRPVRRRPTPGAPPALLCSTTGPTPRLPRVSAADFGCRAGRGMRVETIAADGRAPRSPPTARCCWAAPAPRWGCCNRARRRLTAPCRVADAERRDRRPGRSRGHGTDEPPEPDATIEQGWGTSRGPVGRAARQQARHDEGTKWPATRDGDHRAPRATEPGLRRGPPPPGRSAQRGDAAARTPRATAGSHGAADLGRRGCREGPEAGDQDNSPMVRTSTKAVDRGPRLRAAQYAVWSTSTTAPDSTSDWGTAPSTRRMAGQNETNERCHERARRRSGPERPRQARAPRRTQT